MANHTNGVVVDDADSCPTTLVVGRCRACLSAERSGTCHAAVCKENTAHPVEDTSDSFELQSMDLWEGRCQI